MKKKFTSVISSEHCIHRQWITSLLDSRFEICYNCRSPRAVNVVYVQPIEHKQSIIVQSPLFNDSTDHSTQDVR